MIINWGPEIEPGTEGNIDNAVKVYGSDSLSETTSSGTAGNHVYFYGQVTSGNVLKLIQDLRKLDRRLQSERVDRDMPSDFPQTPIWMHINSGGGDLFAGLTAADQLVGLASPVYAIVEGLAASAATLLVVPCTRRYILPSSFMLIHQISTLIGGVTHREMRDVMGGMDEMMRVLKEKYLLYTKIQPAHLDAILLRDLLINAERCVELGLVDEIKTT